MLQWLAQFLTAPIVNGFLDAYRAKLLDWSALLGAESAGHVMVIMGVVMILLRLVTRTAVSFKAQA